MMTVEETTAPHIRSIAGDIRALDAMELKLFLGKEPLEALQFIQERSQFCRTVMHDGHPSVLVGYNVTDLMVKLASPFMIATNYAEKRPLLFARYSRPLLNMFRGYFLRNYVMAKNDFAIRWLKWMNFDVHGTERFAGQRVHLFTKDCR